MEIVKFKDNTVLFKAYVENIDELKVRSLYEEMTSLLFQHGYFTAYPAQACIDKSGYEVRFLLDLSESKK